MHPSTTAGGRRVALRASRKLLESALVSVGDSAEIEIERV